MGIFDRFASRKGKEETAKPKTGKLNADEAKNKAFAAVPASEEKTTKKTDSKKSEAPVKSLAKESTDRADRILLQPVVTEKSTRGQQSSQYTFLIQANATKVDVRQAVQHVYGVRPTGVNIVSLPGKWVRYGRSVGRTVDRKKAIVSLPTGKTIDISK